MSTIKTSDAVLRSYLLGRADDETTSKVDEGYFTDNAFAERVETVERDLIDDYVNGELDGGERERFESYYLASPKRREKVDFARALRSVAARQFVAPAIQPDADSPSFWSSLFAWRGLIPAAAGLLIVAAFVGWIALRQPGNGTQTAVNQGQTTVPENININAQPNIVSPPENQVAVVEPPVDNDRVNATPRNTDQRNGANNVKQPAPVIATVVLLPQLRGSGLPAANIPNDASAADFRLELETEATGTYNISLTERASGTNIWSRRGVRSRQAGDSSVITVRVPAKIFKSGNYTFSVSGGETAADYTFRVAR